MIKKFLPILCIYCFVLILYFPALSTYFSQDDFFHFKVSQANNLSEFIDLFGFQPFQKRGIAFYRPISRELLFSLYYPIFGLNAFPFRIFSFLVHFLNIYLVYIITKEFFRKKYLSLFVAFFFGISSANVATLYYLAGGIQALLATTFTLLTIILFLKYLSNNSFKFKFLTIVTFLLAIASEEQAIIIPLILLVISLIYKKYKIKYLIPFFIAVFLLLLMEFLVIGFSTGEKQYQSVFNIKTMANSLFWYTNWAIGLPETLIDFVFPGLKLNPTLLRYWSKYYIFIFPSYFISTLILSVSVIYLFVKKRFIFKNEFFLFSLIWFPLGILPIILLPFHKSTHYLYISLAPFWMIIGYISLKLNKVFKTILIISLIVLSSASAILGSTNYWAATRGRLVAKLITQIKTAYPNLPKGATLYIKNDPNYPYLTKEWGNSSKQASIILNGSDALQLLYKDPTLQVYYEDLKIPNSSEKNVYPLVAKIY